MKYEYYECVNADESYSSFEFVSVGHNRNILKLVLFTPTSLPNIYNLAFGDKNEKGDLDDLTISNNGDRNKILSTILRAVDEYTCKYPDRYIFFKGSTEQRTRLYRMAVALHLEELSETFEIYADISGDLNFVLFQKGLNVKAFLVKRKFIKFGI